MRSMLTIAPLLALLAVPVLSGCSNTPPIGNTGGRVPTNQTTQAESNDS